MTSPVWDDVRFWLQVVRDSERVVYCHPQDADRCRAAVERAGLMLVSVRESPACAPGTFLLVDEQGVVADRAEMVQGWRRDPFGRRSEP